MAGASLEEIHVKEVAASRASRVVVLADSSKLAPATLPAWLPLEPTWTLVTDGSVAAEAIGEVRVLTTRR